MHECDWCGAEANVLHDAETLFGERTCGLVCMRCVTKECAEMERAETLADGPQAVWLQEEWR